MQDFVHLNLHTDYSLLESAVKIPALAQRLIELEMRACAITDSGNLYGSIVFYNTLKANGLQPIFGYEAYLTLNSRHDRSSALKAGERPYFNLTLLAESVEGYHNLVRLASKAYTEGFHHKPRIDLELLTAHHAGLIALSGGLNGLPAHYLGQNRFVEAVERIGEIADIIGRNNFFLEIQDHDLDEERTLREGLLELSNRLRLPLVATNEVRYLTAADARAHEIMTCIGAGKTINDASRPGLGSNQFYLRSAAEMWQIFGSELPEALTRTVEIAERCRVELPKANDRDNLPQYPIPPESACQTTDDYFEQVTLEGFENRRRARWQYALENQTLKYDLSVYHERIKREIEIIKRMGYGGYFLIVWDFVRFARENNIPVGPGRGSAAGSLVAYCLEITDVDPIQYDLLFERFLNPDRVSMPDIDIDFCIRGREAVIGHVVRRYGRESVCQIITFGTMASRAVIKDVGRALEMPYADVEKIAKLIPPPVRGRNVSISQALEQVPELVQVIENDRAVRELVDLARRLEGCARHTSVHAAGVVIAPRPLHEVIPVATTAKNELTTQYAMADLEKLGMLKMDFLALTTLTVINDCLNSLKRDENEAIRWDAVPLDDARALKVFGDGKTEAIFQFESSGMQEICARLKPKELEDLSALNALYRPGPLDGGMVDDFINRHRGDKAVRYLVPEMKGILNHTYGILVYQEQIMQLAQQLAGYSLGEADLMRRAMGKKKRDEMARHEEKFVGGAVARNIKPEKAQQIFSLMAQFADYGFNRSHSVAYAYLAYQTAYLKAHHPTHFFAAVLSHEAGDAAKTYRYISELQAFGVSLLPPDVNQSAADFTPLKNSIRFGLGAIKGLGESSVSEIMAARGSRPFASVVDFVERVGGRAVGRRALENLICAGAFDSLNTDATPLPRSRWRALLLASIGQILSAAQKSVDNQQRGQHDLFGGAADNPAQWTPDLNLAVDEQHSPNKLWNLEKELLGVYLSGHPLDAHRETCLELNLTTLADTEKIGDGAHLVAAGMVSDVQIKTSKKGNRFAVFKLSDQTGSIKCLAWSESFNKYQSFLTDDNLLVVAGKLEIADERNSSLIVAEVTALAEAKSNRAVCATVTLPRTPPAENGYEAIFAVLNRHRGSCAVVFELPIGETARARINPHGSLTVQGSSALENELRAIGCRVSWHTAAPRA